MHICVGRLCFCSRATFLLLNWHLWGWHVTITYTIPLLCWIMTQTRQDSQLWKHLPMFLWAVWWRCTYSVLQTLWLIRCFKWCPKSACLLVHCCVNDGTALLFSDFVGFYVFRISPEDVTLSLVAFRHQFEVNWWTEPHFSQLYSCWRAVQGTAFVGEFTKAKMFVWVLSFLP